MQNNFHIDISLQTPSGPQLIGGFHVGSNREVAQNLFARLKGSPEINGRDMIYIECKEIVNGLPVNMDILTCDLHELGMNTMIITQDIFRETNLSAR